MKLEELELIARKSSGTLVLGVTGDPIGVVEKAWVYEASVMAKIKFDNGRVAELCIFNKTGEPDVDVGLKRPTKEELESAANGDDDETSLIVGQASVEIRVPVEFLEHGKRHSSDIVLLAIPHNGKLVNPVMKSATLILGNKSPAELTELIWRQINKEH